MESVAQVARRKKLIAGFVGTAMAVTVVTVTLTYWRNVAREEKPARPVAPVPSNVHQQLSGYTFTRSDEGRQIFTVHAARTVAFKQGGTTVLEDVYVEVFGKNGNRRDVLRTRRADYNAQSGDLFSSGKVQIELNPPAEGERSPQASRRSVMLETSQLYFRQQGSRVMSDEPVRYRVGPISGSARGMTYATKDGWLELKQDVRAELRRENSADPPIFLTASQARYDKEKSVVTLAGPVELSQGTRHVQASSGVVSLDARSQITRVVLTGAVRARDTAQGAALEGNSQSLRADFDPRTEDLRGMLAQGDVHLASQRPGTASRLAAQQVELSFAGKHPEAQRGTATGNVKLEITSARASASPHGTPGTSGREKKELTASGLRFSFQSHGQSLRDSETVGPGKLVVTPSDPKVGDRIITAGKFLMAFDGQNHLETLRGLSGTRIVYLPAKNAPPGSLTQESSADRLDAAFDPATQAIRTAHQTGNFRFREGDRQATAEQATYRAETDSLALAGKPLLWDTEMRMHAEQVGIDLRSDTATGIGKVQSTHFGASPDGEPTSVLADRVVAQRKSETAHYEGHVRAWRGTDVIESASLDVYRHERRMSSGYQARTSHMQPAALGAENTAASPQQHETRPVTIQADRLEYFDQGRKASYRGNVRLQTEDTTLEADRMDAYFSGEPGGQETELERAIAEGRVRVTQPERRATGNHGEYYASNGKIILTGGPPTLYDTDKGFTSGRRLTFYIRDDRLQVDGGDESPTISKHRIAQ